MRYCCILGRTPSLSVAELESVLPTVTSSYQIIASSPEVLVFETAETIDASALLLRLGGTIKLGILLERDPINASSQELEELLLVHMNERFHESSGRVTVGFSVSSLAQSGKNFQGKTGKVMYNLRTTFLSLKKRWRAQHQSLRIVTPQKGEFALSSVVVSKNHLATSRGAEFLFLLSEKKEMWLARTLAVQPFESYAERDFGRPSRTMATGLLPPKLAQIIINLSCHPTSSYPKIWDPFCGFGTIIAEALLMGYRDVHGSDINPARIADSRENLEWLEKISSRSFPPLDSVLHHHDANMPAPWPEGTIDAVITEGYLGPVISHKSTEADITKARAQVEALYRTVFPRLRCTLKDDGAFIITLPVWYDSHGVVGMLPLESLIKGHFAISLPLDTASHPWAEVTERNTILYHRAGQLVGREIVMLKPLPTT